MKKRIVTIILIALILTLSLSLLSGCFLQNLSFISGSLSPDALAALEVLKGGDEEGSDADLPTNFTQINKTSMAAGENSMEATFQYKFTEKGMYCSKYTVNNGTTKLEEYYYQVENDKIKYYAKDAKTGEWYVTEISKDSFEEAAKSKSDESEDTRANLFDAKNYKSAGSKYKYTGPDVYKVINGQKMNLIVDGLYVLDGGVEIKAVALAEGITEEMLAQSKAAGYDPSIPVSYKVVSIGSTTISFPQARSGS
ncbi:MAG: hypothetical protein IJS17_03500 [Clostridia bacterium]|nr:hypothetical protein [Clostridia bacterium]